MPIADSPVVEKTFAPLSEPGGKQRGKILMAVLIRPRKIRLEASSLCQLKCPACPNASDALYPAIGRGYLKHDQFVRLLDRHAFVREVELSNYGEIFLNPDLVRIMESACRRGIRLRADTGANLNTAQAGQLEGLVKYGLRSLTCSLDGATAETYGRYRVNGDFNRVIGHVRMINEFKRAYRTRYPALVWQFIVFGHNEHEIETARRMAHELGMGFKLKISWDAEFSPIHDPDRVRQEVGYAFRAEYREHHGLDPAHGICRMLWEQPQINWDGRVLGCARNFWGEFGGNAFSDNLQAVFNSERMNVARRMLIGQSDAHADVPCSTCNIYHDRVATGRFVNRGLAFRLLRWGYRSMRNLAMSRLLHGQ